MDYNLEPPLRMHYVLEPSLQRTALVKVAAILWNLDDVKNLLTEFCYTDYTEFKTRWEKIEAIVVKKVVQLPLPKQMKEKISCFIRPIGLEIKRWKHFLYNDCCLSLDLPNEFCWTSLGTIDRKRTAEVMIKDESIDIIIRYSLACIHCLEDDISKLWDKIPKGRRISLYNTADHYVLPLIEFWTYYIKKDARKMNRKIERDMGYKMPLYNYAFKTAVLDGCRVAAEYFLEKINVGEIDVVSYAMDIAYEDLLGDNYADVLCSLLSYLHKKDQIDVFKCNPSRILTSLLDYPFQHFFMETASYMWNFLKKDDYVFVLAGIVIKITGGYKDFDYQKLLGEFWQKIPFYRKRHVLNERMFYSTIRGLFEMGDEDNIRLIFQDATPAEKKHLFYHDIAHDICKNLLNGDDPLSLLKYFIRECLPSKDEVIGFKEQLESGEIGEFQLKFLHVLDEVICEFNKRKLEEADNSKAKKLCSAESSDMKTCSEKYEEEYCI